MLRKYSHGRCFAIVKKLVLVRHGVYLVLANSDAIRLRPPQLFSYIACGDKLQSQDVMGLRYVTQISYPSLNRYGGPWHMVRCYCYTNQDLGFLYDVVTR